MEFEQYQSIVELHLGIESECSILHIKKCITNRVLDKRGRPSLGPKCTLGAETHSFKCRARFEINATKELAEAEIASCTDDSIPSNSVDPAAAAGSQLAAMEANTDR